MHGLSNENLRQMAANTTAEQIQLREFENVTCIEGGEAHPITPYTVPAPPLHPPPPCCVVGWRLVDFWLVCRLLVGRSAWKVGVESVCFFWLEIRSGRLAWKVDLAGSSARMLVVRDSVARLVARNYLSRLQPAFPC